jgi:hypothetical protein
MESAHGELFLGGSFKCSSHSYDRSYGASKFVRRGFRRAPAATLQTTRTTSAIS